MFEFTSLRVLHQDMRRVRETRAVFPFEYNSKHFSCIFLVDIIPYRLYLTTLGASPMVFELEIEYGYMVQNYLDDYDKLRKYLELKYDLHHIFKPNDFFEALNRNIPSKFDGKPSYREVLITVSQRRKIEERNKIYFCKWLTNSFGRNVSPENLEKTRSAFGDEKAKLCSDKNISSCWTDIAIDENLKKLNEIDTM